MSQTKPLFSDLFHLSLAAAFAQAPNRRTIHLQTVAPIIALTDVRVIDETGLTPNDDQTIVISDGKIQWVGPVAEARVPANG